MAEQVTISELELAESLLNDMVIPVETSTKTYSVTLKTLKKFIGTSLPLGCIVQNVGITDDERLTLLDGKILSRAGTYKDFCDKVVEYVANGKWKQCTENEFSQDVNTYGQCGKFVITNDYVRIPKITRFLGATVTLSEIGVTYAESLPNIKGEGKWIHTKDENAYTGPFYLNKTDSGDYNLNQNVLQNGSEDYSLVHFNASRSSTTYQDGAKVQPDHTKYPYYMIVSSEGQVEPISVDINQVMEDLNAINEACLHKTGSEKVNGEKRYQGENLLVQANNIDVDVTPSSSKVTSIRFVDKNNKRIGNVEVAQRDSGNIDVSLIARNRVGGVSRISAGFTPDGKTNTFCDSISDAADNSNKIANTKWVNRRIIDVMNSGAYASKGDNWVKFTNGLLVQWGQGIGTITFPQPFTSTSIQVVATRNYLRYEWVANVDDITKTNFLLRTCDKSDVHRTSGSTLHWIAIGF